MKSIYPACIAFALALFTFTSQAQVIITAVFDCDLPGGLPKGVELYVPEPIADLSPLGLGCANNGGGSDSVEFSFPAVAVDGDTYIYITDETASFESFFGFSPDYETGGGATSATGVNGDDAIELFWNGTVIDVFGDINMDGTGTNWEYQDGWVARKPGTGPDGDTFVEANWIYSGPGALDGDTTNATASSPVPLEHYTQMVMPDATVIMQNLAFVPADVTIEAGQTVRFTNVEENVAHNVNGQTGIYPCNPVGFFSGPAEFGPYDFDLTFNQPGHYDYQCDPHLLNGMVGTVTVVDPDAPVYPTYDIVTVTTENAEGVADSIGTDCSVTGIVHGPNFRPGGLEFVLIDAAGDGIAVFESSFNNDCYNPVPGDMLVVSGEIGQFNGLTQLYKNGGFELLSDNNPLMDPIQVDAPLDESHESRLVKVDLLTVNAITATGGSGWNLDASNDNGDYLVRLDSDLFSESFAMGLDGQTMHVTGLVGQFDTSSPYTDGYQVLPRGEEDIEIVSSVHNLPVDAFRISPNPVRNTFAIDGANVIQEIVLFRYDGTQVKSVDLQSAGLSRYRSSMHGLHSGIYVLQVITEEGVWTSKIVKL